MVKNQRGLAFVWLMIMISSLLGCASLAAEPVTPLGRTAGPALSGGAPLPEFKLSVPASERDRNYLGLTGTGQFTIGQLNARIVLIEVFSFYCPLCQKSAAHVNELYEAIEQDPRWKGKIKMIGIGVTNSAYEVNAYRERYKVPFPLFPDQDVAITEKLAVRGTPSFIGVRITDGGKAERFFFSEGDFGDTRQFLAEIIQRSGFKEGERQ
jgi:thiol-disulfide isomerase/thioredoxin